MQSAVCFKIHGFWHVTLPLEDKKGIASSKPTQGGWLAEVLFREVPQVSVGEEPDGADFSYRHPQVGGTTSPQNSSSWVIHLPPRQAL